jgi:Na+/H+ antiporter NhaD/arsenite permease-like protein
VTSGGVIREALGLAAALVATLVAGAVIVVTFYPIPLQKVIEFYVDRWMLWLVLYIVMFIAFLLTQKNER